MAKSQVMKKAYNETAETVDGIPPRTAQFKFLASGNVLTVSLDQLKPEIVTQAALHGLLQKIGDAAAGSQGEEAEEACNSVLEQIVAGQWNATREKGEQAPSVIALAVYRFKEKLGKLKDGETLEVVQARYAGKEGQKLRSEAQSRPEIAAIILEIQQERLDARKAALAAKAAATPTDADAL